MSLLEMCTRERGGSRDGVLRKVVLGLLMREEGLPGQQECFAECGMRENTVCSGLSLLAAE